MAKSKPVAYVVPHTHWDREWRYPIWTNRVLLVRFMDHLLETLEADTAYRCFVLDGQSVAIEDYLEARPENEARVRQEVEAGRLAIGPWYTLPDLYPLDGECLVRNLLRGVRVSEGFGRCLRIGYTTFGWGQTAQFPQLYAGFGFEFIVTAKRVSAERAPKCEFLWESPDGTRVLTTRLGEHARANVFLNAYLPVRFGVDYFSDAYRYTWGQGVTLHPARPDRAHEDHGKIDAEPAYHAERVEPGFRAAWAAMDETAVPDCRLLMDGSDFTDCQPILTRMIADANAAIDEIEFTHGTLEEYADELAKRIDTGALPVVHGELRDGPAHACSGNALATRIYIKVLNKEAQNVLLRWAEPLCSAVAWQGAEYPRRPLETAWTHLLKAHPHDSINGVTQDKTAEDTVGRIRQAVEIGQAVGDDAVADLVRRVDLAEFGPDDVLVVAVNPRPRPARGTVRLCVDLPRERNVWSFRLAGAAGRACDVQPVSRREHRVPVNDLAARPWPFDLDRHEVWVDLGELPAGGYKVLRVEPTGTFNRLAEWWPKPRTSPGGEIATAANALENEHLRAEVESDGTVTLHHKATGRTYRGLLAFEDSGDVGDYWARYPPYGDRTFTSRGCPVRIWCEENGPLAATLGVEVTMTLPARGHRPEVGVRGESRRSDETRELIVTSHLTLVRGSPRLDVRTVVENTVEDHRLRVLFPTDLADATHSSASGHFTVDERPIEPRREPDGTFYPEMQTHPQQHFVDLSDGRSGLAVLSRCFTEYEVLRDGRATLALTLLRAVRNLICTEWRVTGRFPHQKGGQCLRRMEFDYALYPHAGRWHEAGAWEEADALNAPPQVYQTSPHAGGHLPPEASFFSVEPAGLVLSALKKAEDRESFILRLFNPTPEAVEGRITLRAPLAKAWLTNLNEERQGELPAAAGRPVAVEVPSAKIVTVELEMAEAAK